MKWTKLLLSVATFPQNSVYQELLKLVGWHYLTLKLFKLSWFPPGHKPANATWNPASNQRSST